MRALMSAARTRPAEAIALHRMDAGGAQEQMLFRILHAFGGHPHAETAAETDDGVHDRGRVRRGLDAAHEARIDLELVEREPPQIEQARIAGAEVVERKTHADRLEPQHRQFRRFQVAEERAFRELELEPAGVEIGFLEDALDHVDEIRTAELQRRNIDRDRQARPVAAIEAGAAQHPFAELDDEAGIFGDRNKDRRRNDARGRMRPARQRLDADHGIAAGIDDRLIGGGKAVVSDRVQEIAFQELALRQIGVHGRVVDAGAIAAFVLGAIERHVGVAQNIAGVARAPVDHRDADRGADIDGVAADRIGRAHRRDDAPGDRLQRIRVGCADGQDGEFVAAEARDEIVAAHHMAQPLSDRENELVADMVAERIVDVLEVIEVDEEHGGGGPAAAHFADQSFQPFAEIDAVGQPADRIVQGEMAQLRFAGGDRLRGAARVAQDQAAEQGETADRHRDERQNACGHLAARLARVPGDAGDWIALRVGDGGHIAVGRLARILGRAQAGQLQVVADPLQQRAVDELDRQHNRRAGIAGGKLGLGADGHRHDDGRFAHHLLDPAGGTARLACVLCADHRQGAGRCCIAAAAHEIADRHQRARQRHACNIAAGTGARIFDTIGAVDDHDQVVVEEVLEPTAEVLIHPLRIVFLAHRLRGPVGCRHAFDLTQHACAALDDRLLNKLLLALERHLVGAARRGEDRDDETNHRDDDDRANRNDQLQPRKIEARPLAVPGVVWLRRKVHAPTLGVSCRCDDKAKKIAIRLRLMQAKGYRARLKSLPKLTRRKSKPSNFPQARVKCRISPRRLGSAANYRLLLL